MRGSRYLFQRFESYGINTQSCSETRLAGFEPRSLPTRVANRVKTILFFKLECVQTYFLPKTIRKTFSYMNKDQLFVHLRKTNAKHVALNKLKNNCATLPTSILNALSESCTYKTRCYVAFSAAYNCANQRIKLRKVKCNVAHK